jgi:signal transduction histidine kinase
MRSRWRSPSLFWTFAGSFLLVMLAASAIQGWLVVGVAERWTVERAQERASDALSQAGWQILALSDRADPPEIEAILRRARPKDLPLFLVFQPAEGRLISDRQLPRPTRRQIRGLLGLTGDSPPPPPRRRDGVRRPGAGRPPRAGAPAGGTADRAPARPRPARGAGEAGDPGRRGGPEPGGEGRGLEGPGLEGPGLEGRGLEGRGLEGSGLEGDGPRPVEGEPLVPERLRLVGRLPLASSGALRGELAAILGSAPHRFGILSETGLALLFLPLAFLVAGGAGLVLFRLFLRRLRDLERLAARVEAGDLAARVNDPGPDEIGRLGARLNHMTEGLARARDQLDAADQQRRRLLADISHELATPLTSIRGYAETLLDPAVPTSAEERIAYLRNVMEESERMALLIQDLFELTRLEADPAALQRELLDWAELCRNTLDRFADRFEKAGLQLDWRAPEEAAWIEADGRRLEQVLENLLANALRYVPAGGKVRLALSVPATAPQTLQLEILDDGPGIPADELSQIFERFYRASAARGKPGTGLGLAIVQEIVRQHGGQILVENRQPHGTRFRIVLPTAAPVEGRERTSR